VERDKNYTFKNKTIVVQTQIIKAEKMNLSWKAEAERSLESDRFAVQAISSLREFYIRFGKSARFSY
jgi:hypothetical protein